MEGRELRADLQASVFNLERNVRFSATLPPIKEVMGAGTDEDISLWRDRLSTIFHGPESIASVVDKKPGEVHTTLICDALCSGGNCDETVGLLASVPVYNPKTEEVFGFVVINCDINQMLHQQLARQTTASEIVVACDKNQIVMDSMTQKVETVAAHFLPAIDTLQTQTDFIDTADADIYGARLWFIPNVHGVMYLLKRKSNG